MEHLKTTEVMGRFNLRNINSDNWNGPNQIHSGIAKPTADPLAGPMCMRNNESVQQGQVFQECKSAAAGANHKIAYA